MGFVLIPIYSLIFGEMADPNPDDSSFIEKDSRSMNEADCVAVAHWRFCLRCLYFSSCDHFGRSVGVGGTGHKGR